MILCIILGYTCNIGGYLSLDVVSWERKDLIDCLVIFSCVVSGFPYAFFGGYKCKGVPDLVHP